MSIKNNEISLNRIAKAYSSEWEVEYALQQPDPVKWLADSFSSSMRGRGGPDTMCFLTTGKNVEIWMPPKGFSDEPDHVIPVVKIAEARLEMERQTSLFDD